MCAERVTLKRSEYTIDRSICARIVVGGHGVPIGKENVVALSVSHVHNVSTGDQKLDEESAQVVSTGN